RIRSNYAIIFYNNLVNIEKKTIKLGWIIK
ncbi:MAG: hypothetical protein A370_00636, partial [Clostridium sp. Maddingley MBC34-26]